MLNTRENMSVQQTLQTLYYFYSFMKFHSDCTKAQHSLQNNLTHFPIADRAENLQTHVN